jgi:hypothetical protein
MGIHLISSQKKVKLCLNLYIEWVFTDHYGYKGFTPSKMVKFEHWYRENYLTPFCLTEELPRYCLSDVNLLSEALVKFRDLFFEECKFYILYRSCTIASACLLHYRQNIMPDKVIGVTNELSYERHDRASHTAISYLNYLAHKHDVEIQHAHSPEGEMVLPGSRIKLDGFVRGGLDKSGTDEILEINGFK